MVLNFEKKVYGVEICFVISDKGVVASTGPH